AQHTAPPSTQAPPSIQAPAEPPKRRGRLPLSAEEKAARAAAKQAEKEEKARLREEKAAAKKAEKASKKVLAKPASKRGGKTVAQPKPETLATEPQVQEQEHDQPSIAEWKTLTPASPIAPSDVSAIDQLRSSSVGLGDHHHHLGRTGSMLPPSSEQPEPDEGSEISAIKPLVYKNSSQPGMESDDLQQTPLFLPGSSQFPMSQPPNKISHLPPARDASPGASSDSEGEGVTPVARAKKPPLTKRAPFRRLTELAKVPQFQSSPASASTPFALRPAAKTQSQDVFGADDDDDEEEEDDSSGSDSDAAAKSHIPKDRRAGVVKRFPRRSTFFSLTQ
ncbi:hypothetical protein EVG20_g10511, partial [Dentipellis fragilis]